MLSRLVPILLGRFKRPHPQFMQKKGGSRNKKKLCLPAKESCRCVTDRVGDDQPCFMDISGRPPVSIAYPTVISDLPAFLSILERLKNLTP